jgi:hypothetical protein
VRAVFADVLFELSEEPIKTINRRRLLQTLATSLNERYAHQRN